MSDPILVQPANNSWVTEELGACCELISRGTAPSYVDTSEVLAIGQRCVSNAGFIANYARPHDSRRLHGTLEPRRGDVLLNSTGTGTIGRSCVFDGRGSSFIVDGHVTVLRLGSSCDDRWVNASLRHPDGQRALERYCYSGSTNQVELSRSRLSRVHIARPPLPEQQRIADVLDALDDVIRKAEEVIAKLQQMKQGLLHDLLTRGIDDNGELRDPERHPEQFKDSELGRIPRGWDVKDIAGFGRCVTGATPPSGVPGLWEGDLPFVTPGELSDDGLIGKSQRFVSVRGRAFVREIPAGSVLVVCIGSTLGKSAIANERCATNQQINAIVPAAGVDTDFLRAGFCKQERRFFSLAGLQAVPIVNKTQFERVRVVHAPSPEQLAIGNRLRSASAEISCESANLAKLRQLKSALADDLLTGRVRVPTSEPPAP